MFRNLPLVIIECGEGNAQYTFAGNVPVALLRWQEATLDDIRAGRSQTLPDGQKIAPRSRVFDTRWDAAHFAWEHGAAVECPGCGHTTAEWCPCQYADEEGYRDER